METASREGQRRLRKIAKICVNYGQRVQNSVFECSLDVTQYVKVKHQLIKEMDKDKDSIRFYTLGNNWQRKVEHVGTKASYNPEDTLII